MINFLMFFTIGIIIGIVLLKYMPLILKYLPEIDIEDTDK